MKGLLKRLNLFIISLGFFCFFTSVMQAEQNASENDTSQTLSRFRIAFGRTAFVQQGSDFEFGQYFFNLNFRSSGFKKNDDQFRLKFAFEPGINALLISEPPNDFEFLFLPYAKFGPEVKLNENFLIGGSIGILLLIIGDGLGPFPFWGLNSFYLIPISSNFNIELECGLHTAFSERLPLLFYINAGFSLD